MVTDWAIWSEMKPSRMQSIRSENLQAPGVEGRIRQFALLVLAIGSAPQKAP